MCDFIELCEEWHHRLKRGAMPDARELERFGDLIESGSWRIPCPDGTELRMRGGPVFSERQVSWNHPEPLPSRERAAWEAWRHLTGGNT